MWQWQGALFFILSYCGLNEGKAGLMLSLSPPYPTRVKIVAVTLFIEEDRMPRVVELRYVTN